MSRRATVADGDEVVVHVDPAHCLRLRTKVAAIESSEFDAEIRLEAQDGRCFICGHALAAADARVVQVVLG